MKKPLRRLFKWTFKEAGRICFLAGLIASAGQALAQTCSLYPVALPSTALSNVSPNTVLPDIIQGQQPGNFGWLTWAGSPSVPTLVTSLTPPGNSATYVNPDNTADHQVSVGDWVQGKPGVSNSKNVRDALDALKQIDITVPVWSETRGQGERAAYRVSAFARIRILGFQLPGQNRITARFLGFQTCDEANQPPAVHAGPDQTITLPASATLNGSVSDDGLPADGTLTVSWSVLSGPGTVSFGDASAAATTASFSAHGTYVLRLTASDSQLSSSDDLIVTVNRENRAPLAESQSLTNLEDNALDIVLTGSDPDGDALSFLIVDGPSHGTLTGLPPNVRYTPFADYNGPDSFTFKANDGLLDSPVATVTLTNLPVNDPPVADSQSRTNLEDTPLAITVSGADIEGSPLTFTLLTAPTNGTLNVSLGTLNSADLIYSPATNYHGPDSFTFKANDGVLDSAVTTVSITVVSVNDIPIVDAGPDQLVTFSTNAVTLAGTVTDDFFDGSMLVVEWSVASGPGTVAFANAQSNHTSATFSPSGTYVLRLTGDDGFLVATDDVVIVVNAPPVVSAGTNQAITLPASAALNGAASDDGLPANGAFTVAWSKISGPGSVIFSDPGATNTTASFGENGIYVLRLTASDGSATATNDVTIIANRAPIVDAGSDRLVTNLVVALTGTVSDDSLPPGVAAAPLWSKVSGPGEVTFGSATSPATSVTFSQPGIYVLRLSADDSLAATSDEVIIAINAAPLVDAGTNQTISLFDTLSLNGFVSDDGLPPGVPVSTVWSVVSGPGTVMITDVNSTVTTARFTASGQYVLRLTASDTLSSASAQLTITVLPPNQPPMVHAGQGQLVLLPNAAVLQGTALDDGLPVGSVLTVLWSKVSGPGDVTFANLAQTNTTATFSAAGNYILRLTATDGELSAIAQVTLAVRTPAMNEAPVVSAGPDKIIGLTNVLALGGTVADDGLPQGAVVSAAWTKLSGPGDVTFANAAATNTTATFSALGTYVLRLFATDSALASSDEVRVTVYPFNQPPIVDAGPDQSIIVPDPALLSAHGQYPTNPSVELSLSLFSVPQWNNALGQPGLTEIPANGASVYVPINSMAANGTNLYVSGFFRKAGGVLVKGIARWDGVQWSALYDPRPSIPTNPASPPVGFVADYAEWVGPFAERDNELFVSGGFLDDHGNDGSLDLTARWTGSNWVKWEFHNLAPIVSVRDIAAGSNLVVIGGEFLAQPTNGVLGRVPFTNLPTCANIIAWDGTNWLALSNGFPGVVRSVAVGPRSEIYAAGNFELSTPAGVATNIAVWNGTNWAPLGAGVSGCVRFACRTELHNLTLDERGVLYAAGELTTAGGFSANFIARWDGTNWSALGSGPQNGVSGIASGAAPQGRDVYVGGGFSLAGGFPANNLARWNGQFWSALGPGPSNGVPAGYVGSVAASPQGIYVAGGFFSAGGFPAGNVAFWEFAPLPQRGAELSGTATDDGLPMDSTLALQWTKVSGPGQVTFASSTNAATTATFSALGTYVLRLTASDSDLSGFDDVTIEVRGNQPPTVAAGPDQVVEVNQTVLLAGAVVDDGAPAGASVAWQWSVAGALNEGAVMFDNRGQTNGTIRFTAGGTYVLRLIANDSQWSSSDDVVFVVRGVNFPPNAVARTLPETVAVGQLSTLTAHDLRDDGLPYGVTNILWSQVFGPAPIRFFNPTSAVCQAMLTVPGAYRVRVDVNDGELSFTSEYHLNGVAGTAPPPDGNQAPNVSAGPDITGAIFQPVALHGTVSDDGLPNGGLILASWSRVSGPGNVYFANAAHADTSARFFATGTYVLRLVGSDGSQSISDEVTVTVIAPTNEAPFVVAGPDQEVVRPAPALLEAWLFDDALPLGYAKTFAWSVVSGPGTVTITPSGGNISNNYITASATFGAPGEYVLRVTVSDSEFTDFDELTVTVIDGTNAPPLVNAGADSTIVLPNSAALTTDVSDDGLPAGLLEVSWSQVSGPGSAGFSTLNGQYLATFTAPGVYVLRLTATDYELVASDDVQVTVLEATDPPTVVIVSPLDAAIVTAPTVITGIVSSPILQSWKLECRLKPSDTLDSIGGEGAGFDWITLAAAVTQVNNAPLATFDPTLLLNGLYELQLTATDQGGRTSSTNSTLVVDRNMKVGHFTLSFNDLTLPVAGIPIQVIRTYDSRDKRVGDFGVGWTLDLKNVRLQKNRHLGRAWEQTSTGGLFPNYCIDTLRPRVVTITFPDGRVQKFRGRPVNINTGSSCQALVPLEYPTMVFEPVGGNTFGTLVPLSELDGQIVLDEQLIFPTPIPGRSDLISFERLLDPPPGPADNILFNPDLFEFTSQEGYRYILSETNGLRSVTDPNGNTLTITTNGITWTNVAGGAGLTVAFQRDALGRITNVVDALGHAMTYRYDTNGNLITFTDRAGNTNGFTYDGRHQLLTLADARGIDAVRNEYDEDGRILRHIDANGQQIAYAHDINHRLEIITNRLGFVTLSEYDSNGNVVRTVAPDGGITAMTYDANDNLLSTVDSLSRTNTFTYDARDNRTGATDPLGHTTTLTYNDLRRVTSATDARGNNITNRYDAKGNLLSLRDPLGRAISFAYSDNGLPLGMTNSLGHVMRFAYDAQGRLTNEVDALGHGTGYLRDTNGNLLAQSTTRTRSDNSVETLTVSMQYDSLSRLTNTVFPGLSSARTIYNAIGKPAVTIDQLGRQTLLDYDTLGRMTRVVHPDGNSDTTAYDAEGRRIASTNRLGQVTQYNYDAVGRLFRMVQPDGTTTTNYFDLAGQLRALTDARGFNTFYGYDAAGRSVAVTNALLQVSQSGYDETGNLIAAIDALSRTNRFFYDALNRRTNTLFADGSIASTLFDELGRRIAETDQNTNTTRFAYDNLGRLRFVTNALGKLTEFRYNELGQQTHQIDANLHSTTLDFDQLGRRVLRTLPGGQFETYGYNLAGLMTGKRDFNGRFTTYTYDVMNRLEQKVPDAVTGEPTVQFAYNALGQRTNMVDASGSTSYRYDGRNRLMEKVKTWAAVGLSVALNYAYDANGNVTNVASSSPNGTTIGYEYDALSRLSAVNDLRLGRTTYAYDDVGNLQGYALPNGVTSAYTYDALNRLTNLTSAVGGVGVAQYLYGLSPAGHRLTAAETVVRAGTPQAINRVFGYDATYRLLGETITGAPNSGSAGYTYDDVGNRLSRNTTGFAPGLLDPQSFAYDANDRLNTDSYDANGNTLLGAGFSQTQADSYDFENRLIERRSTIASITRTVNVSYDGDGHRVSKTVNGVATYYLVDDLNPTGYAQVLEELSTLNTNPSQLIPIRLYAYGHDLLSQDQLFDTGTNLVWSASFHGYDGHGSTRYLTDLSGTVTDTYDYDAFGNLIAQTGSTPNLYLYSGEQFDPDLNLYYLRARYHNPQTGRFWSMDSFEGIGEDPASLHKYTYCGNKPVNGVDPNGNFSIGELAQGALIAGLFQGTVAGISSALGAYFGGSDLTESINVGLESGFQNFGEGFVFGLAGGLVFPGVSKVASWALAKYAPYLLEWTPTALLSAFNRTAGLLKRAWASAEAAWATLETAIVQGTESAIRSAEAALFQARAAISSLSGLSDRLAAMLGYSSVTRAVPSSARQTGTILWSGPGAKDAASWLANNTGGVTLEMTELGARTELATIGMDYLTQAKPIWEAASKQFVQQASGEVTIVLSRSANSSSIFFTTEWSALLRNPNVTGVKFVLIP